jgi:hypothetical protein
MWLTKKSSSTRLRAAQNAFRNRQEILKAWSQGQISRRDLLKWGIFSVGGVLVAKSGLSPFVGAARADNIPTGLPSGPLFGVKDFLQPAALRRPRASEPFTFLNPSPTASANLTQQLLGPRWKAWWQVTGADQRPPRSSGPGSDIWAPGLAAFRRSCSQATRWGGTSTVITPKLRRISGVNRRLPFR